MTAIFELHLPSETLAADELSEITGAKTSDGQRTWLDASRWKYHTNRAGRPIVGRMYGTAQARRDRGVSAHAASVGAGFLADRVEDHDQQRKEDDESVHGRSTAGGRAVLVRR